MDATSQAKAVGRFTFGMALMIGVAAQAADANDGGPTGNSASSPVASTVRLAMMDGMGMGEMGGGAMPAGGAMPSAGPPDGMPAPMADPSAVDAMGRARGPLQAQRGMSNMPATSRLPGFPGSSHLYHVGASGFFLDHPQHITLSTDQQTTLNRIKEKALLDRANSTRRIEEAEQELWTLTAADVPDGAKIEAKVRAIEKLGGDQRLAVIRAVGEAAKVLTADQQAALLGTKPPAGSKPAAPSVPAAVGKAGPMAAPIPVPPMPHM
jgi:Spy/CpxP family protein refolding chaperone